MLKNEVKKEMQYGMDDPVNDLVDDRIRWTETPILVLKISITCYWTIVFVRDVHTDILFFDIIKFYF
jgi:hypothetical protein